MKPLLDKLFLGLLSIIIMSNINSCKSAGSNRPGKTVGARDPETYVEKQKHLNISILLDLSDRIDPVISKKSPGQIERDKSIIQYFIKVFKANIDQKQAFKAKAKFKVFFHPQPSDPGIASAAKNLVFSCNSSTSPEGAKRNKQLYFNIDSTANLGLNTVYSIASKGKSYPGSNIWRFMKDDVKTMCIEPDTAYRNILVILTDGFMYHANDKIKMNNRFSYIERTQPHFIKFRDPGEMAKTFSAKDYGFIKANQGLNNLEVIVMETSPPERNPGDYDIIKKYWDKWLAEMDVAHYEVLKSDLPAYMPRLIKSFLLKEKN